MEKVKKEGKVVTFYSYKGGVGRTMSMVNVAVLMAKQNKKVLLIDWDLEAPGLHAFFLEKISTGETGLVDFIADIITFSKGNDEFEDHQWHDYFEREVDKHIHKDIKVSSEINIDIIKAGKFDNDYTHRLNNIDWLGFYQRSPYFFSYFSQYLESHYDYIFIDSRTGLSDTGGICTMLMPQILVLVFALNDQNINGVIDVAKQSLEYRFTSSDYRDLNILPLPSRIDNQNSTELQQWISKYSLKFEELFKESYLLDECSLLNYFNKAKIPYKPEHAYGEKIPVLTESTENDFFISYHYDQFCKLIKENIPCWDILSATQIEQNLKLANEHFKKGLELYYQQKYKESIKEFEKVIDLSPDEPSAYGNLGLSLVKIVELIEGPEVDFLYHKAFENFQKVIDLQSDDYFAYSNWGTALGNLAKSKSGIEAENLYLQSFEKLQKAIEIKSDEYQTFRNWGYFLGCYAAAKGGFESEYFYLQSIEKLQKAIEIKFDFYDVNTDLSFSMINLAKTKKGKDRKEVLFTAKANAKIAYDKLGQTYNLACCLALLEDKSEALKYLKLSLENKEVTVDHVLKDDDWKEYWEDEDFNNFLSDYK